MSYTGALVDQALRVVEQKAQGRARRAAGKAGLLAAALFATACAAVFGSIAIYLALIPEIGAVGAGLVLAGGWLAVAAVLALVALSGSAAVRPEPELPSQRAVVSALERDARSVAPLLGLAAGVATGIAALRSR